MKLSCLCVVRGFFVRSDHADVESAADGPNWSYIEDSILSYRKSYWRIARYRQPSDSSDERERIDDGGEPVRLRGRPWFGLKSRLVPCESTRDFCSTFNMLTPVRERNFLSWVKFFMMTTVLSATMFLDLQIQDLRQHSENITSTIEHMSSKSSILPLVPTDQDVYALGPTRTLYPNESPPSSLPPNHYSSQVPLPAENIALGTIYIVVAFVSWGISTYDYFKCVRELETEHTYLDECEGHTHPVVTVLSIIICVIVLSTVILMLVQRTT